MPDTKANRVDQKRFNIEVTEKDIQKAKRNDSYVCVVSQAIARAIPDATSIETDTQAIRFTRNGQRYVYLTPYAVQGYVIAFDAGDEIKPFSFQLRDPAKVKGKRRTPTGLKAHAAATKARKAKRKQAKASGLSLDDPDVVDDVRDAATAAYAMEIEKATGPIVATSGEGRKAPPRVFRRKQRSYGHRLLRINQESAG